MYLYLPKFRVNKYNPQIDNFINLSNFLRKRYFKIILDKIMYNYQTHKIWWILKYIIINFGN